LGIGCRGLVLAETVQVLGLGRVVAVTVNDHGIPPVIGGMVGRMLRHVAWRFHPIRARSGEGGILGCIFSGEPLHTPQEYALGCGPNSGRFQKMADSPRLNNIIRALEAGQHALTCFAPAHVDSAVAMSASQFDGCVFEMEHNPWDSGRLRDCLQYMLNRAQIAKAGLVPPVTPMVRVPVNGVEMAQWQAKQALDVGCFGIVFPHISTVEEAPNAVGACRYPPLKNAPPPEPVVIRGDGPTAAARYWGVGQQEYYGKADVWPLNPQ